MSRLAFAVLAAVSGPVLAHPGQHPTEILDKLLHLLTAPDHWPMLVLALIASMLAARVLRRAKSRPDSGS